MKLICKELSSKTYKAVKSIILCFFLVSICILFLPTVSVEGKSNDSLNQFNQETIVDDFDRIDTKIVSVSKVNPNLTKTVNMKHVNGNGQTAQWLDLVFDRINTVVESCKGKFSSLDMILIPLNLNSNQWINH